jgi:hypothetical protein
MIGKENGGVKGVEKEGTAGSVPFPGLATIAPSYIRWHLPEIAAPTPGPQSLNEE